MYKGENIEQIDGYIFKYDVHNAMYECRGDVCYDDEHDEIPEENLWIAANKLANKLQNNGFKSAEAEYSEKGWVEVCLNL